MDTAPLPPELVLRAYVAGAFPMADAETGDVDWYSPDPRAILPLEPGGFRVSRSLVKRLRRRECLITSDRAFERVIRACAEPRSDGSETWISQGIIAVYTKLHHAGFGHSVEAWRGQELVGGIYGLAIGSAFFAESMFSRVTDASKVCLYHLVEQLRRCGFTLLDVQFQNDHIAQFGVVEIARDDYMTRLQHAVTRDTVWEALDEPIDRPSSH